LVTLTGKKWTTPAVQQKISRPASLQQQQQQHYIKQYLGL
jgi:hypothetical protein